MPKGSVLKKGIRYVFWWLATWPDKELRGPEEALRLAKHTVEARPDEPRNWSQLGVAHYRRGNFQEAVAALEKHNKHAHESFFLAMAHWQLGNREKAPECYDQALERLREERKAKPEDKELARFRAEAVKLLGISDPPQAEVREPRGSR